MSAVNGGAQAVPANPRITAYQVAARLYCQQIGQNPDAEVSIPHPVIAGAVVTMPCWYTQAERMHDLALMLRCISEQNKKLQAANDGAKINA